MLFATPAGERHEFGTLGAALMAAGGGLGAIYVGPDLPADDLIAIAGAMAVDVIALGVTGAAGDQHLLIEEVRRVAHAVSRDVEVWVGGPASEQLAAALQPRLLAIADYDALEWQLVRLGARF
jgi:methylmalonyl-CoA mutase cobalamin-binding subunit